MPRGGEGGQVCAWVGSGDGPRLTYWTGAGAASAGRPEWRRLAAPISDGYGYPMRTPLLAAALLAATIAAPLAAQRAGRRHPACDPDNAGIVLPPGFCALMVADSVGRSRHIAALP